MRDTILLEWLLALCLIAISFWFGTLAERKSVNETNVATDEQSIKQTLPRMYYAFDETDKTLHAYFGYLCLGGEKK